jgi:hypothetical protein
LAQQTTQLVAAEIDIGAIRAPAQAGPVRQIESIRAIIPFDNERFVTIITAIEATAVAVPTPIAVEAFRPIRPRNLRADALADDSFPDRSFTIWTATIADAIRPLTQIVSNRSATSTIRVNALATDPAANILAIRKTFARSRRAINIPIQAGQRPRTIRHAFSQTILQRPTVHPLPAISIPIGDRGPQRFSRLSTALQVFTIPNDVPPFVVPRNFDLTPLVHTITDVAWIPIGAKPGQFVPRTRSFDARRPIAVRRSRRQAGTIDVRTVHVRARSHVSIHPRRRIAPPLDIHPRAVAARLEIRTRLNVGPWLYVSPRLEVTARLQVRPWLKITARLRIGPWLKITPRLNAGPRLHAHPRLRTSAGIEGARSAPLD